MPNRLVMSLKSTSDYLFQLAYSLSPQTQLLDSINILYIDPEPPGSTCSPLNRYQQDLLQLCILNRTEETRTHPHVHRHVQKLKYQTTSHQRHAHTCTQPFDLSPDPNLPMQ